MKRRNPVPAKERNVWKIVSAVFIALFIIVMIAGILNSRFRPPFMERLNEPTQEQIEMARSIVTHDLQARGDNISDYEVLVMNRMVGFISRPHPDGRLVMEQPESIIEGIQDPANIQVLLRGNSTGYLYIINADSQKIVMRSFTEWLNA
jgi:hypothetical protein